MRNASLIMALFLAASVALAGGAGGPRPTGAPAAPPAVTSAATRLPATALVRPGQTWVVTGKTVTGEAVSFPVVLNKAAPKWEDGWVFETETGLVFLSSNQQSVQIGEFMEALLGGDAYVCFAAREGQTLRGALLSGEMETVLEQLDKIEDDAEMDTYAQITAVLNKHNLKYGSCTIARK